MGYTDIVILVTNILSAFIGLLTAHFFVIAIIGLFRRKTFPEAKEKLKYGLIIPARNEEAVVGGLIESIQKNNYPQDKLHIFVIAHNCTDKTAEVARSYGVNVYEYNNPEENTMGYAFRYLFTCIERDFGTKNFDGFFLFNADNILDQNYFSKMNDAFQYYDRKCVVTSYRNSKNFGTSILSGLYGMYFTVGCSLESRGRAFLGSSTRVQGTGYVVSPELVKNGWKYVTLAEDWEFNADQILLGNNIRYCDDAIFYDEQPTKMRIMWRQRVRWKRGHFLVFRSRIKELIKSLFAKDTKNRFSHYDMTVNCLPIPLVPFLIFLIQMILLLIAPLVSPGASLQQIFIGDSCNLLTSSGMLFTQLRFLIGAYLVLLLNAVVIFIRERKRIHDVSFLHKVLISLCWPLFLFIQIPIDVHAFFARNLGWKPIPHSDKTSFDSVNTQKETPSE